MPPLKSHLLIFITSLASCFAEDRVSYNADVRPILSDKCFLCHGPDQGSREAGLRLDIEEEAFKVLAESPGKHAIVPGSLENSVAWLRITDTEDPMPPLDFNVTLSDSEKATIGAWIKQGAKYEKHWSFVNLPKRIPVPEVAHPGWPRSPIDHFVAARLEKESLSPSPEASPLRWFRRTSLAITGLPPTLAQITTFKNDLSGDPETAYEKAADSLLSTRAYGEHFATPWLDAVRYADTWGYHADMDLTAWPYRDYVIRAFESDMPYDRFITENIAGDLLPNATTDQKLATASNRFNRMTNEGGSIREEFFLDGVADRVNTFGTAYLGLTMECSKCHDHKYDPITAKEYFQLSGFFNSINEDGLYIHGKISPPPSLLLPSDKEKSDLADLENAAAKLDARLAQITADARPDFEKWQSQLAPGTPLTMADQSAFFDFNQSHPDPLHSRIQPEKPLLAEDGKPLPIRFQISKPEFAPGPPNHGSALSLNGDDGATVQDGFFSKDSYDPFSVGLWLKDSLRDPDSAVVWHRAFGTEVGYHGIDLRLQDGYLAGRIFRAWPDNGLGIKTKARIPQDEWQHVTMTYDGRRKAEGLKFYLNGEAVETVVTGDQLYKSITTPTYSDGRHFTIGAIFRGPGFAGGNVDDMSVFDRAITALEARHLAGKPTPPGEDLFPYYLANFHPEYRATLREISAAHRAIVTLEDSFIEVPVMEEMDTPRPARILARGEYHSPIGEPLPRDTFAFLLPFPKDAPADRLGLAQWLTDPRHPLTSRVYVNRIWQQLFGEGLVGTMENFGLQGDLPTHPKLLDWLCRDFIAQGWSTKALVKQIVLSATYRQDSALTAELRSRDIHNKLLARGPAFRMSGEQIRDSALASSGLLRESSGGPPVHPYSPLISDDESPEQVHRRSIYSYWKRTKPQPNMTILDKPSLEVCSVKRSRTNSPAMALVLLNDRHFIEAARTLANDLLSQKGTDQSRLTTAWLRIASSDPTPYELATLKELLEEQRTYFKENPQNASKLLSIGVTPQPEDIDTAEAAAMTTVCQTIFNTDSAVWTR